MGINLLELMQGAVSGQVIDRVAGHIGEDPGNAKKAVGGILPAILGGLIGKVGEPGGADQLGAVVDQADGTIIDNIGKIFDGADGGADRLQEMGGGLVSGLMGDKLGGMVDLLSKSTGMSGGGIQKIMGLVVPLIFSVLGKQKNSLNLDAGGLANLLNDQKGFLKGLLPAGMGNLLGVADLDGGDSLLDSAKDAIGSAGSAVGGVAGNAVDGVKDLAGDAAGAVGGAVGKVGDVAGDAAGAVSGAVGGAVGGAKDLAGDAAGAVGGAVGKVGDVAGDAAGKVGDAAGAAADKVGDVAGAAAKKGGGLLKILIPIILIALLALLALKFLGKLGGGEVKVPSIEALTPDNALSSMTGTLKNATSVFGGIKDVDSAKAALPKIDELTNKVSAIGAMKDKLPAGVGDKMGDAVKGFVPKFQGIIDKAYAIPGVKGVLEPKVESFMGAFSAFEPEG